MKKRVAIFGGGMAGLSVAHELVHRDFDVSVYEREMLLGGKSANQYAQHLPTGVDGRLRLPGEHGFRFFPGFYRNIIATLDEIPRPGGGVITQDLVPSANAGITWNGTLYPFPRHVSWPSWDVLGRMQKLFSSLNFTVTDLARMSWYRLKYLTSGPKRRDTYDAITWWDFIDGESSHYSAQFREFESSIPRTMSAMVVKTSSAKVIGDITMQFMLGYGRPGNKEDRAFAGPTTVRWLEPWRNYLESQHVTFHVGCELDRFVYEKGSHHIGGAIVRRAGVDDRTTVEADYYVAALPIEVMQEQLRLRPALAEDDPALGRLAAAPPSTAWMVGAQLYLAREFPLVDGHVFYPKSPWALTSVSQAQFWEKSGRPMRDEFGDGTVNDILSLVISDWDTKSPRANLTARQCPNADALLDEVQLQLQDELGSNIDLSPQNVRFRHLDHHVTLGLGPPAHAENRSPLLVHPINGLAARPAAHNVIENLFLASDYVRTSTELATMEGANEAARRAANAMLDVDGKVHVRCSVWELQEESLFDVAKQLDDLRFAQGRPHFMDDLPGGAFVGSPQLLDRLQEALKVPAMLFGARR